VGAAIGAVWWRGVRPNAKRLLQLALLPLGAVLPALVILCREILVSGLREFLGTLAVSVPVTSGATRVPRRMASRSTTPP